MTNVKILNRKSVVFTQHIPRDIDTNTLLVSDETITQFAKKLSRCIDTDILMIQK